MSEEVNQPNLADIVPGVLLLVKMNFSPVVLSMPDPKRLGYFEYELVSEGSFMLVVAIDQNVVPEFLKPNYRYIKVLNLKTQQYGYFPKEDLRRVDVIIPKNIT